MPGLAELRAPAAEHPGRADRGDERPPDAPRRARRVELAAVAAVALALVVLILRPVPLDSPVIYARDTFQHLALIEAADWTGTPQRVDRFGAPHGSDWSLFPSGGERLQLVALHALRAATGSPIAAVNLYTALALVATAVVSHAVLRWIGCRPSVAGAAACLFALSPSALQRLAPGHLFLFALFPVALGVFAALWALQRPPPGSWRPSSWRRSGWLRGAEWAAPLAAVVVVAVSSTYYAIFTGLLLAACSGVAALRRGEPRRLAAGLVLLAVLAMVSAATLAPNLLARRDEPAVAASFDRPVRDSETYGLRPAQLLMPRSDHPVPFLADLGERAGRMRAPGDAGAVLGLAGVAGLVAMAVVVVRRRDGRRDGEHAGAVGHLSLVAVAALALGTAGSGGFLLAVLGLTQVRVWSRLAAFVLFCALAGLGLLAQRRWGGARRFPHAVALVAAVALVDQGAWVPDHAEHRAALREDEALVEQLVDDLPRGALAAQLPVVPFPDHMGSERLLAPALLADGHLRSTAGAFRGDAGDWQDSWLAGEGGRAAVAAAAAGADVLLVQRTHRLVRDPDLLDRQLGAAAGIPVRRSERGIWSWVDLRPLHAELVERHGRREVAQAGREVTRPIGLAWEGVANLDFSDEGRPMLHLGDDGVLRLHLRDGDTSPVEVSMRLQAARGTTVEVVAGGVRRRVEPGPEGAELTVEVHPRGDVARVQVRSDGDPLPVRGSEGPARVLVTEVTVRDLDAARSPVLAAR